VVLPAAERCSGIACREVHVRGGARGNHENVFVEVAEARSADAGKRMPVKFSRAIVGGSSCVDDIDDPSRKTTVRDDEMARLESAFLFRDGV
jgi:hypothetical protein